MPVNEKFLESAGKTLVAWNQMGSSNGPYILKSFTSKSQIELEKNPDYYDKKNVHIDTVKLTLRWIRQDYLTRNFDGNLSTARLFPSSTAVQFEKFKG